MRKRLPICRTWLIVLSVVTGTQAGEEREIRGRVVDATGRPVADADVDVSWRANGTGKDRNGKYLDLKKAENVKVFWGHLGQMEPCRAQVAATGADGQFAVTIAKSNHAVMAMDRQRQRGGIVFLPTGREDDPIEIRIGPLVKVRGTLRGPRAGEIPTWTHVYLNLPDDPTRPLDSTRLVSCGSHEARFEMSVPPGRYVLQGYNETSDAYLVPEKEVPLALENPQVDLGVLTLSNAWTHTSVRIARAKAKGLWVESAQRYGKPAPPWHITDARGISKDAHITDFKGKWILIYFWGFGCKPCLKSGLPTMAKFYEEHAADRDRFEIVAFCIDDDGELATMAAVDRKLEPVVKQIWEGKPLPFPSVLDASFQTMERFGISRFGPLLVDPEGKLMKGDEAVLAEKLRERLDRQRAKSQ